MEDSARGDTHPRSISPADFERRQTVGAWIYAKPPRTRFAQASTRRGCHRDEQRRKKRLSYPSTKSISPRADRAAVFSRPELNLDAVGDQQISGRTVTRRRPPRPGAHVRS